MCLTLNKFFLNEFNSYGVIINETHIYPKQIKKVKYKNNIIRITTKKDEVYIGLVNKIILSKNNKPALVI